MHLALHDEFGSPLSEESLARLTELVARASGRPIEELGVKLVDEPEMASLARRYKHPGVTDVLSFPNEGETGGDIVICLPIAERQANEHDWPLEHELFLLVTHGALHLVGFDHQEGKQEMIDLQAGILRRLEVEGRKYG